MCDTMAMDLYGSLGFSFRGPGLGCKDPRIVDECMHRLGGNF